MLTIPIGHTLAALRDVLGDIAELSAVVANRRPEVRELESGKMVARLQRRKKARILCIFAALRLCALALNCCRHLRPHFRSVACGTRSRVVYRFARDPRKVTGRREDH